MKFVVRLLALLAVVFALYVIVGEQLVGSSGDAFINAPLASVRAPQNGTLQLSVPPLGSRVQINESLGNVVGRAPDDGPMAGLQQDLTEAQADLAAYDQLASDTSIPPIDRERAKARATSLQAAMEQRRNTIATRASSELRSPVSGIVWSVRTVSTEYVPAAEPLLYVADCSSSFIYASVDQGLFNRLKVGSPAQFRFHGGRTVDATVSLLAGTGPRTLLETLAITPTERQLEGFAVLLSAPGLGEGDGCPIGSTGRVIFSRGPLAFLGDFWSRIGL